MHARASKGLHITDQIKNDDELIKIKMFYSYRAMKQTSGASERDLFAEVPKKERTEERRSQPNE